MTLIRRWRWRRLERARGDAARRFPAFADALHAPLPRPSDRVRQAPLLAMDLEMTGLDPASDTILTIGWVPIDAGGIDLGGGGEIALAPVSGRSVGDSATIHGIRDCDRDGGMDRRSGLAAVLAAIAGRVPVFHHAPLDTAFLDRALRQTCGFGWLWPSIDTLAWFRRRRLERDDEAAAAATRLDAVRDYYGLAPRAAHNALDDAMSCAEVTLILAAHSRSRLIDACRVATQRT